MRNRLLSTWWLAASLVAATLAPHRIALAGGGCEGAATTDIRGGVLVEMRVCFVPTVLHVAPGTTVTWVNRDVGIVHTVTAANRIWESSADIAVGQAVSFRFDAVGTYPYACVYHPGMVGAVVVGVGTGAAGSTGDVVAVQAAPAVATTTPSATPGALAGSGSASPSPVRLATDVPRTLPSTGDAPLVVWPLALAAVVLLLCGLATRLCRWRQ